MCISAMAAYTPQHLQNTMHPTTNALQSMHPLIAADVAPQKEHGERDQPFWLSVQGIHTGIQARR
jgi:hypothetical protein